MLPVENFVNEKKENVWADTKKKYSR
jgi:hypothetical protein